MKRATGKLGLEVEKLHYLCLYPEELDLND